MKIKKYLPALVSKIFLSAVVLLLVLSLFAPVSAQSSVIYGDVNEDGIVDVRDVSLINRYILGLQDLTVNQLESTDVTFDDEVDVRDASLIVQYVLGVLQRLTMPVVSVEPSRLEVEYGTVLVGFQFPEKVWVHLADGRTTNIEVEWSYLSEPIYNPLRSGTYRFKGKLVNLPREVSNPGELEAVLNVVNPGR